MSENKGEDMMETSLAFCDDQRQEYCESLHWTGVHDHQFLIGGGYNQDGSVQLAELVRVKLFRFRSGLSLAVQFCIFDEAFGTMRELERIGVFSGIENREFSDKDEFARFLIGCGLKDVSDRPLPKETVRS